MNAYERSLQRLVDGEMASEERLAFLQEAEGDPLRWREIALAYVEAQTLEAEIGHLFDAEVATPTALPHKSTSPPSPSQSRPVRTWTLAAGIVAIMTATFLVGRTRSPQAPPALAPSQSASPSISLPVYEEPQLDDGWTLNWRTEVLRAKLPDGRRVVVPVSLPAPRYQGQ